MNEDVLNDLQSVRPCAQIRSLRVRTFVCVRTHRNAITHRTITWRWPKAMSVWWTAVMWIWILKKKSFFCFYFSMMRVESFIFNAAHKSIHYEDGKALLTAESCSLCAKKHFRLEAIHTPNSPGTPYGTLTKSVGFNSHVHLDKSPEKTFGKGSPVNENLKGNWTNQSQHQLSQLASAWDFVLVWGATLDGCSWVVFN